MPDRLDIIIKTDVVMNKAINEFLKSGRIWAVTLETKNA